MVMQASSIKSKPGTRIAKIECLSSTEGFTLIEMVVALALLGLLLGGVYSLFSGTIMSWRKAEARADMEQNLRIVSRLIAMDLENAIPGADADFSGNGPEEGSSVGGRLQLTTNSRKPEYGTVAQVIYEVTEDGLYRRVYLAPALQSAGETGPVALEDELISPLVRRITPQFLVGGEWQEELTADTPGPPQAVQVTIWAGEGEDETAWRSRRVETNIRTGFEFPFGVADE